MSDSEQTLAESDQTLADADQTSSDSDQASADCDQLASDRDQAASDRDLAAGVDADTHDVTQGIRERAAARRDQTGRARVDAGEQRDALAHSRDLVALARDRAADARDRAMAQHELGDDRDAGERLLTDSDEAVRAKQRRKRAAQYYAQAAEYRALAAEDRQAAAQDRERAAHDRLGASSDPPAAAPRPAAGLSDVDRELDRCRRTNGCLAAAFVEVVVDDSDPDDLSEPTLERVTALVRLQLRSYDLLIHLGGGRLVCVMSSMTLADARERFTAIRAAITDAADEVTIQTGFADVAPGETATELIARAEHDLSSETEKRKRAPTGP